MRSENRLSCIDGLRVAVSLLAIAFRAGQAYGFTGGFWPVDAAARSAMPGPFLLGKSFFMELFFLVSGWFMVIAYERRGPRAFLKSRLIRLGVPLLVSTAVMIPLARWKHIEQLWYLQQLLLFSFGYALWRWIRRGPIGASAAAARLPGSLVIITAAVVLAALSLLGFFPAAFTDAPRDLAFFVLGGAAAACLRHRLLPESRLPLVRPSLPEPA